MNLNLCSCLTIIFYRNYKAIESVFFFRRLGRRFRLSEEQEEEKKNLIACDSFKCSI